MRIRWLGWAGVEVEVGDDAVVVDLLGHPGGVLESTGLRAPVPRVSAPARTGAITAGLCTHLHRDHADAAALATALAPGAPVLHPAGIGGDDRENLWTLQADAELTAQGLRRVTVEPWQVTTIGAFTLAAVPAVDALGDPQVSWVIAAEGRRVLHLGDTMFHGWWWRATRRFGPFDAVLVPINGPRVCFPHCLPPSPYPASLDAEQAAVAVRLLGGPRAIPIHYGGFHLDGFYETGQDEMATFLEHTRHEDFHVETPDVGDVVAL